MVLGYLFKFYVEMLVSPRIFHIREGVGTCQTPIGNWGLVNDLCRLVPTPPNRKYFPYIISCVFVRCVLFQIRTANSEASKTNFFFFCR